MIYHVPIIRRHTVGVWKENIINLTVKLLRTEWWNQYCTRHSIIPRNQNESNYGKSYMFHITLYCIGLYAAILF